MMIVFDQLEESGQVRHFSLASCDYHMYHHSMQVASLLSVPMVVALIFHLRVQVARGLV